MFGYNWLCYKMIELIHTLKHNFLWKYWSDIYDNTAERPEINILLIIN